MIKKFFLLFLLAFSFCFIDTSFVFSANPPISCAGLPGCADTWIGTPWAPANISAWTNKATKIIARVIAEMIKYTAVLAVISLMIAGIMYLVSWGQDEKIKKAKQWIIWALVGVVVSTSAWFIVNMINNIYITV